MYGVTIGVTKNKGRCYNRRYKMKIADTPKSLSYRASCHFFGGTNGVTKK